MGSTATLTMLESSIDSSGPASRAYCVIPARARRRAAASPPGPAAAAGTSGAIGHHRRFPQLGQPAALTIAAADELPRHRLRPPVTRRQLVHRGEMRSPLAKGRLAGIQEGGPLVRGEK